jgi:hypothetical protein
MFGGSGVSESPTTCPELQDMLGKVENCQAKLL